jgi:hypothetical protein
MNCNAPHPRTALTRYRMHLMIGKCADSFLPSKADAQEHPFFIQPLVPYGLC